MNYHLKGSSNSLNFGVNLKMTPRYMWRVVLTPRCRYALPGSPTPGYVWGTGELISNSNIEKFEIRLFNQKRKFDSSLGIASSKIAQIGISTSNTKISLAKIEFGSRYKWLCREGWHRHGPVPGGAHGPRQPPSHRPPPPALRQEWWIVVNL